jgi:outer membrane protein, heavy metal efflux system
VHRRWRKLFPGLCAAGVLAGCQTYEAEPLDLPSHRAEWLGRDPGAPGVREFAARLAAEGAALARPFELSDGLELREAEAIALFYNPDLRIARLRAGVTAATVENSGLWADPTLAVDTMRILQSVDEPWKIFASVGFTLPISGRLGAETARAGAEHAAELARVASDEWTVRVSLRAAWAEWSAASAKAVATRDFMRRLDRVVGIAEQLRAAGELSASEARPFLVERATRRADLRALEGEVAAGELMIKSLMGLAPTAALTLTPAIGTSTKGGAEGVTPDSPAMLVAAAEYEVSERALALEIRKQYPDLTIGPGYASEQDVPEALLSLSLPLPVLNANRQSIAEARARRALARVTFDAAYERLSGQFAVARAKYEAALAQREQLESEVVPLVDAQFDEATRIAELGEVNTMLLLDTLTRQYEAKLRVVDARLAESMAMTREQELTGPPGASSTAEGDSAAAGGKGGTR